MKFTRLLEVLLLQVLDFLNHCGLGWLYSLWWLLAQWKTRGSITRMKKAGEEFSRNSASESINKYAVQEIGEMLASSEFQSIYGFPECGIFDNPSERQNARLIKLLISSSSILFFDASDFERTKIVIPLEDIITVRIDGPEGHRLNIETKNFNIMCETSEYHMAIPVKRFLLQLGCCHKVEY